MATFTNDKPSLVSGYGLVVGLSGTGSSEVPPWLRPYMVNMIRRGGLGNADSILADLNTTVVSVQGLIGPGASKGDPFDVYVECVDSSTISLAGGRLFTSDMQAGPPTQNLNVNIGKEAEADGSLYTDPASDLAWTPVEGQKPDPAARSAIILGGGRCDKDRPVYIALNQPSYSTAAYICQAINQRFPQSRQDRRPVAEAANDQQISLNIPQRYRGRVGEFLDLVRDLYIQNLDRSFIQPQAARLAEALRKTSEPEMARRCINAWRAMDRAALPAIQPLYKDANPVASDAAMQAGLAIGDSAAILQAAEILKTGNAKDRERVAKRLALQPDNRAVVHMLTDLMSDREVDVRVAAYEAMANIYGAVMLETQDPKATEALLGQAMHRSYTYDADGRVKFAIDTVPFGDPLVLVSSASRSRVVVMGPDQGLSGPNMAKFARPGARITLDVLPERIPMAEREKRIATQMASEKISREAAEKAIPGERIAQTLRQYSGGKVKELRVQNGVAALAFALGHHSHSIHAVEGLDFDFASTARFLLQLKKAGILQAPLIFRESMLAAEMRDAATRVRHAETPRPEGLTPIDGPDAPATGTSSEETKPGAKPDKPPPAPKQDEGNLPSWK